VKLLARRLRAATGVLLFTAVFARGATLVRGPAIGRVDDSTPAVVWWTDAPSDSRLDAVSPDGAAFTLRSADRVTRHVVALPGLASSGRYRYQAYSDETPMGAESTVAAPRGPDETAFRFGVIGDTATGHIPAEIADRLLESGADLVIHTGDVVYPDGADELYDQEFFRPMAPWLSRAPVLPSLGNHDVHTDRGAPLLSNFVLPRNAATGESRFYAFRHANALFVCLDVESSAFGYGSQQYLWLVETLATSTSRWKFVYFHEPPYSSAGGNGVLRLILAPVFERYGVDVVFCGHEHLYERTFPIREFGFPGPGVVYITEGGGGADLDTFQKKSFSAFVVSRFGYTIGDVSGSRLVLSAHDTDGSVFDSVVLEKAPPASSPGPAARRPRIVERP
jgi:3',5'-cyclic AMP phosphodiesterase CpdA